jgi:hypothetical protein
MRLRPIGLDRERALRPPFLLSPPRLLACLISRCRLGFLAIGVGASSRFTVALQAKPTAREAIRRLVELGLKTKILSDVAAGLFSPIIFFCLKDSGLAPAPQRYSLKK